MSTVCMNPPLSFLGPFHTDLLFRLSRDRTYPTNPYAWPLQCHWHQQSRRGIYFCIRRHRQRQFLAHIQPFAVCEQFECGSHRGRRCWWRCSNLHCSRHNLLLSTTAASKGVACHVRSRRRVAAAHGRSPASNRLPHPSILFTVHRRNWSRKVACVHADNAATSTWISRSAHCLIFFPSYFLYYAILQVSLFDPSAGSRSLYAEFPPLLSDNKISPL
jgi:hypothetical protein